MDNVVLYRTSDGARLVLNEFGACIDPESEYRLLETGFKVGDATNVCMAKEMQSGGENRVWYRIEFIYRNVFHGLTGWGWEDEVTSDFMEAVAIQLFEKLEQFPLSEKVTFEP